MTAEVHHWTFISIPMRQRCWRDRTSWSLKSLFGSSGVGGGRAIEGGRRAIWPAIETVQAGEFWLFE